MALVREGASIFEQRGEEAYPDFRQKGSKWFRDDTYFFVWTVDGTRVFHAADPAIEGQEVSGVKDIRGRPYGKMFLDVAASPSGEGWVHYMYPEPGDLFPAWKSTFLKRVRSPSGKQHLIGAGICNMQMDKAFIEDVVDRAAALIAERGNEAFDELRDRAGPFVFMDTYVFVETTDGVEVVNPGGPLVGDSRLGKRRAASPVQFCSEPRCGSDIADEFRRLDSPGKRSPPARGLNQRRLKLPKRISWTLEFEQHFSQLFTRGNYRAWSDGQFLHSIFLVRGGAHAPRGFISHSSCFQEPGLRFFAQYLRLYRPVSVSRRLQLM